jgi:SIT4-associating protein SAP185/190
MDRGYNRTLAIDLFDTGNITQRIAEGQNKSDDAQALDRMRLGYMGHLTLIAEEVVKFTERHPPELLSESVLDKVMSPDWINYVEITLAETRERDNAILGGVRPDQNCGPRQAVMNAVNAAIGGGSSALADAGLNGSASLDGMDLSNGSGTSGAGFTLTSGSILSGFGSSSDEEDEEMDEDMNDDERGGNAGGAEVGDLIPLGSHDHEEDVDFELMNHEPPLFADGPLFPGAS